MLDEIAAARVTFSPCLSVQGGIPASIGPHGGDGDRTGKESKPSAGESRHLPIAEVRRPTERCSRRGRTWTLRPPRRPTTALQAATAGAAGSRRTRSRRLPAVTRGHRTAVDWPRCARWAGRPRRGGNPGKPPLSKRPLDREHRSRNEYPRSWRRSWRVVGRHRYPLGKAPRRREPRRLRLLEHSLRSPCRRSRYLPRSAPIHQHGSRHGISSRSPPTKPYDPRRAPDRRRPALRGPHRLPRPSTGRQGPTTALLGLTPALSRF